jgi:hypothetical protein
MTTKMPQSKGGGLSSLDDGEMEKTERSEVGCFKNDGIMGGHLEIARPLLL